MYKKIWVYVIIAIITILLRENICMFLGNVFGSFKLDNNYYDAVINLKDEKINYLENELKEYDRFSKNLDNISYNYLLSKIIYKYSYDTGKYNLKYGKNHKVKNGYAVINENGLIGKINKVNKKTSNFIDIRNIKDISVKVNESYGKLNYNKKTKEFIITDISNYDKVYINDKVYTSGYGTIKENIYIGKVIKIDTDIISKKIYIETNQDFNKLNYVLIVGDF